MVATLIHLELLVDGLNIAGDAQAAGHEGQIELSAFQWSAAAAHLPAIPAVSGPATGPATGYGMGPASGSGHRHDSRQGEFRLGRLHLRKAWDRSSAALAQAVAEGARAERAILTVSRPRPASAESELLPIMVLELTDAALLDLHSWSEQPPSASAGGAPRERLAGDALILCQQLTLGGPMEVRLRYFAPPAGTSTDGPSDPSDAAGAALTVQLSSGTAAGGPR